MIELSATAFCNCVGRVLLPITVLWFKAPVTPGWIVRVVEQNFSELRLPKRGKKLFSNCNCALKSLPAHVHAFKNDFLKLSLKNAYKIGFIAEFEYAKHPTNTNNVISRRVLQESGCEFIKATWEIQ